MTMIMSQRYLPLALALAMALQWTLFAAAYAPPSCLSKPSHQKSTTTTTTITTRHNLHLISLPTKTDDGPRAIRDAWRWKDAVLGDGRDYFIPRPRTLRAFADLMVGSEVEEEYGMEGEAEAGMGTETTTISSLAKVVECVILSNCARMDVLLCVQSNTTIIDIQDQNNNDNIHKGNEVNHEEEDSNKNNSNSNNKNNNNNTNDSNDWKQTQRAKWEQNLSQTLATKTVSMCLASQLLSHQTKNRRNRPGLSSLLDLPGVIDIDANANMHSRTHTITDEEQQLVDIFCKRLDRISDVRAISRHFNLVAAGLGYRPSRPDRNGNVSTSLSLSSMSSSSSSSSSLPPFRPFSSRDAHILLQLKRTASTFASGTTTSTSTSTNNKSTRTKIILDCALSAGKKARDVHSVPSLQQLRDLGLGGSDEGGRYGTVWGSVHANSNSNAILNPKEVMQRVLHDVELLAIEPEVERCVNRLYALEAGKIIGELNQRAALVIERVLGSLHMDMDKGDMELALELGRVVKKMLHEPILRLRNGEEMDVDGVLEEVEMELQRYVGRC